MKATLLSSGGYWDTEGIEFPVVVDVIRVDGDNVYVLGASIIAAGGLDSVANADITTGGGFDADGEYPFSLADQEIQLNEE
ncbi:hypothetical protein [Vibrio phage VpV262]|uniref:Uncharacterized protein n=1 Tax=Vibrio phage VpV262 TaxID=2907796 RepID=Q8LT74_9CAUD|nr:hypothetical protein VpV262p28 [Vibrio phage VpV262]AAM28376.1 hypothetical protein [Vibrio phage VpV262]